MRTTVEFDADTARAVEDLRRERGVGVSEAVNVLIRRGLLPRPPAPRFRQRTTRLGLRIDVSNIAEALESLDGADAR
ncbi:MAG: CopG family transcriptional regulator [Acidimicrobiales bacterium]